MKKEALVLKALQQEHLSVFKNILKKLEIGFVIIPPVLLTACCAGFLSNLIFVHDMKSYLPLVENYVFMKSYKRHILLH